MSNSYSKVFKAGESYTFSVDVKETKGGQADNVVVTFTVNTANITLLDDTIPAGTTFAAVNATTYTWSLGSVINQTVSGVFEATAGNDDVGHIDISYTVTSTTLESDLSNNDGAAEFYGMSFNSLQGEEVQVTGGALTVTNETHIFGNGGDVITLPDTLNHEVTVIKMSPYLDLTVASNKPVGYSSLGNIIPNGSRGTRSYRYNPYLDNYYLINNFTETIPSFTDIPVIAAVSQDINVNQAEGSAYLIDWGDGSPFESAVFGTNINHTYSTPYTGNIKIISGGEALGLNSLIFTPSSYVSYNVDNIDPDIVELESFGGTFSGTFGAETMSLTKIRLYVEDTFTITYPSSALWEPTMEEVILIPTGTSTGLVTADVDRLLNDLSALAWSGAKIITLTGVNQARSAASDAAVTTLQGLGVTVTTN